MCTKSDEKYPLIGPNSECNVFILRANSPYGSSRVCNYLNNNLEKGIDGEEEEEAYDPRKKKRARMSVGKCCENLLNGQI